MTVQVVTGMTATAEARIAALLGRAPQVRLARRCADLPDLLAVVAAGRAQVVVISADLPGMDRSALHTIRAQQVGVVGLYESGDETGQRTLMQWGVRSCVPTEVEVDDLAAAVCREWQDLAEESPHPQDDAPAPDDPSDDEDDDASGSGRIITCWGPVGAPGRTTTAIGVAVELARLGVSTLLVDADTHGACVAQHLALLDEAPGLAAATRLADAGRLDVRSLASVAPEVGDGLRVLTGLPRADRWPEVGPAALEEVLRQARRLARFTVVDVGAPLEDDEELSYDTLAPRRNAATVTALRAATTVLAVGSADPVGLQRLVRGLDEVRTVVDAAPRVVVTKVRSSAVGAGPDRRIAEALDRFAGVTHADLIPDDRPAMDHALLSGRLLADDAPSSPARQAIAELAADLGDLAGRAGSSRRRRRRLGLARNSA